MRMYEFLQLGLEEKFQSDHVIINESEYVNSAYLVAEGKVAIWKDNIQLATLSSGSSWAKLFYLAKIIEW